MNISLTSYISVLLLTITGILFRRAPVSFLLFPILSVIIYGFLIYQNSIISPASNSELFFSAGFFFLLLRMYDSFKSIVSKNNFSKISSNRISPEVHEDDLHVRNINHAGPLNVFFLQSFLFPLNAGGTVILSGRFQIAKNSILSFSPVYRRGAYYLLIGLIKTSIILPFLKQNFETSLLIPFEADLQHASNFIHTCLFRYAAFFLSFSIAADFAVGFSGILGLQIEHNFNKPYFAASLIDFWRRWSVTVTDWLKIHLFSGRYFLRNRGMILFLLPPAASFLQGARLDFLIFGLIHGAALYLENKLFSDYDEKSSYAKKIPRIFLTQTFVVLSWGVLS